MIRDPWKPQNLLISQLLGRNKKIASIGPIRIPIWHSLQKIKFLALAVWSGPFRGSKNRRSPSNTKKPVVLVVMNTTGGGDGGGVKGSCGRGSEGPHHQQQDFTIFPYGKSHLYW